MHLCHVLLVVQDVHKNLHPLTAPVSVQKIKSLCEKKYGFQFRLFHKASWASKYILGRLYRYEINDKQVAEIVVSDSLNYCWTRYVACKELAQLLIDKKDTDFVTNPIGLINSLVNGLMGPQQDISSERGAMFAAIELLIPWKMRSTIQGWAHKGENNYAIAVKLRVPEKIIETWRSAAYQSTLEAAWNDVYEAGK